MVIGVPIEVENDNIIIQEGIYAAYYDEETGRYTAVAVDPRSPEFPNSGAASISICNAR